MAIIATTIVMAMMVTWCDCVCDDAEYMHAYMYKCMIDLVLLGVDSVAQIFPDDPSNVSELDDLSSLTHLPQSV